MAAGCILFSLFVAPFAWAGFDEGMQAYNKGDYATALREFRLLADQGNAGAQSHLGNMYHEGNGMPQSYAEAAKWYRLAADNGFALAQYNLGVMYYHGNGVPKD